MRKNDDDVGAFVCEHFNIALDEDGVTAFGVGDGGLAGCGGCVGIIAGADDAGGGAGVGVADGFGFVFFAFGGGDDLFDFSGNFDGVGVFDFVDALFDLGGGLVDKFDEFTGTVYVGGGIGDHDAVAAFKRENLSVGVEDVLDGGLYFLNLDVFEGDDGGDEVVAAGNDEFGVEVDFHALSDEVAGSGGEDFDEFFAEGYDGDVVHGEDGFDDLDTFGGGEAVYFDGDGGLDGVGFEIGFSGPFAVLGHDGVDVGAFEAEGLELLLGLGRDAGSGDAL